MTGGPIGTGSEGTFDFFFFPSKRNPEPVKACHNGEKYFCVRFVNDITNLSFNLLACFLENTESNFHFSFLLSFRGIRKLVVLIWACIVYSGKCYRATTCLRASSPFGGYREKYTRERHARGDATAPAPRGFAARPRVLARLASLAQIGELARRLSNYISRVHSIYCNNGSTGLTSSII